MDGTDNGTYFKSINGTDNGTKKYRVTVAATLDTIAVFQRFCSITQLLHTACHNSKNKEIC